MDICVEWCSRPSKASHHAFYRAYVPYLEGRDKLPDLDKSTVPSHLASSASQLIFAFTLDSPLLCLILEGYMELVWLW